MIYYIISSFVKTRKRKNTILNGDFIVKKSEIQDTHTEYNSSGECDDYYIKVDNAPKNWIKVPEPIYNAVQNNRTCYMLYLPKDGQNELFLIYIGKCVFEKNFM